MKPFKQKMKEKAEREEAEQQILAEQAEDARKWNEWYYAREVEKQQLQEWQEEELWKQEQKRKQQEQQLEAQEYELRKQKRKQQEELERSKQDKVEHQEFKQHQKSVLKNILESEHQIRQEAEKELYEIQDKKAHKQYLIKQEEKRRQLEEKEHRQLEEMGRIEVEQLAEQEKYALWERLDKEENDRKEQERLEEEKVQLEDEELRKTAEMLERIEDERLEYEQRQQRIAERDQESYKEINEILSEAQNILHSNQESSFKNKLSGLQDYIYRLNSNEIPDPWTNRKQPISILTWEDWKQIPANKSLIEEDFKRARILFEQDNMRGKRYYDHIWHEMPGRNLTLQRKQAVADEGKLVDINYNELVATRQELMEDIGDIQVWMDASDNSSIHSLVTASMNTASISVMWVPQNTIGTNDTTINIATELNDSASLVISGGNHLLDGNPDTYMSITHTSGSSAGVYDYDWNNKSVGEESKYSGVFFLRIKVPEASASALIERVDLYSTDRRFIPTFCQPWAREPAGTSFTRQIATQNITASHGHAYNEQLEAGSENDGLGGKYGITSEGSASLNPLNVGNLYPTSKKVQSGGSAETFIKNHQYFSNEFLVRINIAATGSEVRFHGLDIWYHAPSGSAEHGKGIYNWYSRPGPNIHYSASKWERPGSSTLSSRHNPIGYPIWYSASINQPAGINMPYVQFSSQSNSYLSAIGEFADYERSKGFTHFTVIRDTTGRKNFTYTWYGDTGNTYKVRNQLSVTGYNKGLFGYMTDWEDPAGGTSANTRHGVDLKRLVGWDEKDLYGKLLLEATASAWPYCGTDHLNPNIQHVLTSMIGTETSIVTSQLDNPMTGPSSSRYRLWHKGGTPFVDVDNSVQTTYNMTASGFGEPQIGAAGRNDNWFDGRIHEMIIFKKVLSKKQIDTVHNYLADKWKLNVYPVRSDADNDMVYAISSSNSSMDTWTYDATDATSTDTIISSSGWELS